MSASITVDTAVEINQLFLEFHTAGVSFHPDAADGNFIVMDPDRNLILFAGPAD